MLLHVLNSKHSAVCEKHLASSKRCDSCEKCEEAPGSALFSTERRRHSDVISIIVISSSYWRSKQMTGISWSPSADHIAAMIEHNKRLQCTSIYWAVLRWQLLLNWTLSLSLSLSTCVCNSYSGRTIYPWLEVTLLGHDVTLADRQPRFDPILNHTQHKTRTASTDNRRKH